MARGVDEERDGVALTHLDEEVFDGAGVTKRELVDHLDAVADRILPLLRDRPLSTVRARPGQEPFMQKNLPKYAPDWIPTVSWWAQASRREVAYALCNERRILLWFANQRAVEYHVPLFAGEDWQHPTHLVMDIDPPSGADFAVVVRAAMLVRRALAEAGLQGAVKTSGSKGVHVFVPLDGESIEDVAAATRALAARAERLEPDLATTAFVREERGGRVFLDATRAGGATVVACYSPRARPGLPVSFPVAWEDLDRIEPGEFNVRSAADLLGAGDPWAAQMAAPQRLPADLVAEGHAIPIARVAAMHAGKRRKRAQSES
jgi:bifunctional non-homologous end joining protein LigD